MRGRRYASPGGDGRFVKASIIQEAPDIREHTAGDGGSPWPHDDGVSDVSSGTQAGPGLRRVLHPWQVLASGVGLIVGAGIYVLVGDAAGKAGEAVWAAFLLAGLLSALTALSYAELASMYPKAGAEYEYARQVFPAWLAFLVGWAMIMGLIVAAGAVALGFGRYFGEFVDIDARLPGLALLVAVTAVGLRGIQDSVRLTVAMSVVQVGGLLLIIAIGVPHLGDVDLTESKGAGGVLGAAALVFFAFIGFDEVNTLAEETEDASRTIPRAILGALAISTTLYVLVAATAVSVLGADALAASERPLSDVMATAFASRAGPAVSTIALISTAATTLMAVTAASRLTYGMSATGAAPPWLGNVGGNRVPGRAIVGGAIVAGLFLLQGDVGTIAAATDIAVYFVFLAVNGTLLILRVKEPRRERPFRVPFAIAGMPTTAVLGFGVTLLLMTRIESRPLLTALGIAVAGLTLHFAWQWSRRKNAARQAAPGA